MQILDLTEDELENEVEEDFKPLELLLDEDEDDEHEDDIFEQEQIVLVLEVLKKELVELLLNDEKA